MMKTETLSSDPSGISRAAEVLRAGGLVAFPTETVYGLGGDARSDVSVAKIFAAKGRPRFNPLIVHVPDLEAALPFALFDPQALRVAAAFWPGPLTLVLPLREGHGLSPLVTAELDSVAIRVPAHPVAAAVLRAFGGPLAAPSANPSGKVSPTRAAHVLEGLSGRIEAVLDGGLCAVGVESTILSLLGHAPALLRQGGIALEEIEALLGPISVSGTTENATNKPTAPGQLASHYAPNAAVVLNADRALKGQVRLGFGPEDIGAGLGMTLSAKADLIEAAANLFHMLREVDRLAGAGGTISVAPIPEEGLGRAINDRLRRAAAPR